MRRSGAERRRTCFVYPPPCYQQSGVTPPDAHFGAGAEQENFPKIDRQESKSRIGQCEDGDSFCFS